MSKSLGTGIDPVGLIDEHGADAVRFGLLLMASTQDVRFSIDRIQQGRQLVTKLWNATRLVIERGGHGGHPEPPRPGTLADRWMASRAADAVERAEGLVDGFEFSALADLLYRLVFDDYCDWYLEALKAGEATPEVAGEVLEQVLRLLHPLMPFVTEECHARLPGTEGLLATRPLPRAPGPRDEAAEGEFAGVRERVRALRLYRSERGLRPREPLAAEPEPDALTRALGVIRPVEDPDARDALSPVTLPSGGVLLVGAVSGRRDVEAERRRLEGALGTARAELARAERQLANERFVSRAPAHLVQAERDKRDRHAAEIETLSAELAALGP